MEPQTVYKISKTAGPPVFDSVPVAKIIDYPLEKRDYKPFAQCILCMGGDRLYLRMWAFEVSPPGGSALECILYPYREQPGLAVHFRFQHGGGHDVAVSVFPMEGGADVEPSAEAKASLSAGAEIHPHNGEDLQGVYWGATLSLPLAALEAMGGQLRLEHGAVIPGNFYKTCEDERFAHKGSLHRADWGAGPYTQGSMGGFQIIDFQKG